MKLPDQYSLNFYMICNSGCGFFSNTVLLLVLDDNQDQWQQPILFGGGGGGVVVGTFTVQQLKRDK